MQRRQFLTAASTAIAAGVLTDRLARPLWAMRQEDNGYLGTIGLQLWTVRNELAEDMPGTLTAIRDAGYHQVELGNVTGSEAVVDKCRELDLKVTSSFMDWKAVVAPSDGATPKVADIIDTAKTFGLTHLVFGYLAKGYRETVEHYQHAATSANSIGKQCNDAGIRLCYHNHAFEFEPIDGGKTGYDILMEEFDPDLCAMELDVFWAQIAGHDPVELMTKLDGRITQVHLKDLKADTPTIFDEGEVPKDAFQELGDGVVDLAAVMTKAREIGVEQCHVEQDQSPDPVASIGQSMTWLKSS